MSAVLKQELADLISNQQLTDKEFEQKLEKLICRRQHFNHEKISRPASVLISKAITATRSGNTHPILPSGFKAFDELIGGFAQGEFVIIGGRPSTGKSQLLIHLCLALSQKVPTLFFTYDLSEQLLIYRMISTLSNVPIDCMLQGRITEEEQRRIDNVEKEFTLRNIFINDSFARSLHNFREECTRQIDENGVKVIFIDHLQLMATGHNHHNREIEISAVSRELKSIARELNVLLIASSHLSRAVEYRPGKNPILSDLRDSGSLEQDADKVIFLYRPEYYRSLDELDDEPEGGLKLILSKNRTGKTGDVWLRWTKNRTKIGALEETEAHFNFSESRLDEMDDTPF